MRCLECEYSLEGLPTGPCPECGRRFDAADPSTYATDEWPDPTAPARWARRIEVTNFVASAWLLVIMALMHLMLVVARLSLGRWPHRFGRDDPKDIAALWAIQAVALVCFLLLPLAPLATLACIGSVAGLRQWPVLLRVILAGVVLWFLGVVLWRTDPAQVLVWFMD